MAATATIVQVEGARERIKMSDNEIVGHFERFGYRVQYDQIAFTTETVDDFRTGRTAWHRAGRARINETGLLLVEDAQPRAYQKTRDIVVISLGYARAVMGVEPKKDAPKPDNPMLIRYAQTME